MVRALSIPIGVDDYKELRDGGSIYVDKTLLIKEFWEDGGKIILVPRPRRFGKTLNLSMLKYFFEKTTQSNTYLFEKTEIWQHLEYHDLQGKFPVIFLTFKDVKKNNWNDAYKQITELLAHEVKRTLSPLYDALDPEQQDMYTALVKKTADNVDYCNSLLFMTQVLHQHTKQKPIVLIDEYDTPITNAYLNTYYAEMIDFIRHLFSAALKGNAALDRAFLTGIMRAAKEGIFSGLNNLKVCTILSEQYSDKFGFTQLEVNQLLTHYNLMEKTDAVKAWYDGYHFNKTLMYNPWSILNFIDNKGIFKTYWVNTSDNELVARLIAQADDDIKDEIEKLLQNNTLTNKEIDESVVLPLLASDHQEPWSFLLFTGYLTTITHEFRHDRHYYTLAIPNKEIAMLYQDLVLKSMSKALSFTKLTKLIDAFVTGNTSIIKLLLQEFISNTCSSHDLPQNDLERSVHMFVLGLLAGMFNRYIIQSNRESGDGRYDIMLMPRDKNAAGALIEFKKAKNIEQATLEKSAQEALQQIKTRNYESEMRSLGHQGPILCYGIAACGKHLAVKKSS